GGNPNAQGTGAATNPVLGMNQLGGGLPAQSPGAAFGNVPFTGAAGVVGPFSSGSPGVVQNGFTGTLQSGVPLPALVGTGTPRFAGAQGYLMSAQGSLGGAFGGLGGASPFGGFGGVSPFGG